MVKRLIMKRKYYIGIAVPLLLFITLSFLYRNVSFGNPVSDVMVMYDNTYSSIGCSSIPEDNKVGEDFSSHLPLIVIDINGKTIPTAYILREAQYISSESLISVLLPCIST